MKGVEGDPGRDIIAGRTGLPGYDGQKGEIGNLGNFPLLELKNTLRSYN